MEISDFINILAIILAPIVSVIIGQKLQNREKRRQDKMDIFKNLMESRVYGWTIESVRALNIIDIIFIDDKNVRSQWKRYYDKLCIENPTEMELSRIKIEQFKLLESMAKSLGYKEKITWETIQNPYIPKGLLDSMSEQQQFKNEQIEIIKMIKEKMCFENGEYINGKNEV